MSLIEEIEEQPSTGLLSPRIEPDQRRHKRVALTLLGRFMRQSKKEFPCKLQDISVGGAAMMSPVQVDMDERIIAYFDQLGGLEGTVVRVFDGGFAIRLAATQHKREKIAAQLTYLINRKELDGIEERRHDRNAPRNSDSTLRLHDGVTIPVKVLDVSLSGASVGTSMRPALGSEVSLGNLRTRVVRHHELGIGLQFLDIQNPAALRRYFG